MTVAAPAPLRSRDATGRLQSTPLKREVALKVLPASVAGNRDRIGLFSMSVASGLAKTMGSLAREYLPGASLRPALRLSLTPDGNSLSCGTARNTSSLWLKDGLKSVTMR
jgi:hypothetical protein